MMRADWELELARYCRSMANQPFEWGVNDCATFAANWRERATGKKWGVPYTDEQSATAWIQMMGGMFPAACSVLGSPRTERSEMRRGDIVLTRLGGRESLGVLVGAWVAGPGTNGLLLVPRSNIIAAWRI